MLLFFDTETTGKERTSDVVQFAAVATDDSLKIRSSVYLLVNVNKEVPEEAFRVHGIDAATANKYGVRLRTIASLFYSLTAQADVLIAHNYAYDEGIMTNLFKIVGVSDMPWKRKRAVCTMLCSTDVCKIPSQHRRGEYKWPSLAEAYRHFTGNNIEAAHDALGDVMSCMQVYRHLSLLGHTKFCYDGTQTVE